MPELEMRGIKGKNAAADNDIRKQNDKRDRANRKDRCSSRM